VPPVVPGTVAGHQVAHMGGGLVDDRIHDLHYCFLIN
jgi:hypothetical protein